MKRTSSRPPQAQQSRPRLGATARPWLVGSRRHDKPVASRWRRSCRSISAGSCWWHACPAGAGVAVATQTEQRPSGASSQSQSHPWCSVSASAQIQRWPSRVGWHPRHAVVPSIAGVRGGHLGVTPPNKSLKRTGDQRCVSARSSRQRWVVGLPPPLSSGVRCHLFWQSEHERA